jgi:hypothetical protein
VFSRGAVFAAHHTGPYHGSAVFTFTAPAAVDVLPGGCLEASVAVGRRTAVHAVFFISIMLMKSVKAFWAAGTEFAGPAKCTFGHKYLLIFIVSVLPLMT